MLSQGLSQFIGDGAPFWENGTDELAEFIHPFRAEEGGNGYLLISGDVCWGRNSLGAGIVLVQLKTLGADPF